MTTLLTAIIFYFLGRYSNSKDDEKKLFTSIKNKLPSSKRKPGIMPFLTPDDRVDIKSGDKELEKEWIKSGKAKKVTN